MRQETRRCAAPLLLALLFAGAMATRQPVGRRHNSANGSGAQVELAGAMEHRGHAGCLVSEPVARPIDDDPDEQEQTAKQRAATDPITEKALRKVAPCTYARLLPAATRKTWARFHSRYPETDPTDIESFQRTLTLERQRYGVRLSREDRERHRVWLTETEALGWAMVRARARHLGLPSHGTDEQGRFYTLTGFRGAEPIYSWTHNENAAISTAAAHVRRHAGFDAEFGPGIDGSGFFVSVNDGGTLMLSPEFRNDNDTAWRVTQLRTLDYADGSHATHVAGTIGARGLDPSAQGMAPAVHLYILYERQNSDVLNFGMNWPGRPEQSIVGNASMGAWASEWSGVYSETPRAFDQVLYDTPYYLHFCSAGNSGQAMISLAPDQQAAKNLMTVGSVEKATRNAQGEFVSGGFNHIMSSRGPARDGRIKPDIVAQGHQVHSPSSTNSYSTMSGTSMASPNAAGSAVLLQDYFSKRFPGRLLRAATLKTLIIHTADDASGINNNMPAPNYSFGWGLMNTRRAAQALQAYADDPARQNLVEDRLADGAVRATVYESDGTAPIRATMGWTDPPGAAQTPDTATAPALVNDLNLRLIGPDGTVHLPFVMPYVTGTESIPPFDDSLLYTDPATGTNFTDNTIQVVVASPVAGDYVVEVSHAGTLTGGFQDYSMALDGLIRTPSPAPTIASHVGEGLPAKDFLFEAHGTGFMLAAQVVFTRDGFEPVFAYGVESASEHILARLDTLAMAPGAWTVAVRNPDGQEAVASDAFFLPEPSGNQAPLVVESASASEHPTQAVEVELRVRADDDGGAENLTYTWASVGEPPAPVVFGVNGVNAASNTVASFSAVGIYEFKVNIEDEQGLSVSSQVIVSVNPALTAIEIHPSAATVPVHTNFQFEAAAKDQFGADLHAQPKLQWSVSGGGTITSGSFLWSGGLFTAGSEAGGPHAVTASIDGVSGAASVTVTPPVHGIEASAGPGGLITPSGRVEVVDGANQSFAITAHPGHIVLDVEIDGISAGPLTTYDFVNVTTSHVISALFHEVRLNEIVLDVAGDRLSIGFFALSNRVYDVLYKNDLLDTGDWQTLTTITGAAHAVDVMDPDPPACRFYRLRLRP